LQGARIELQPLGTSIASNAQGQFFINDLDRGSLTVTITYVGFKEFTKQVTVVAGQTATVDVKLEVASQNLEVLVTAERASGEAGQVNREITSDNIVQVLSADVIRSLPNANMADALGRLPSVTLERDEGEGKYVQVRGTEPRLTNVTIDGINVPSPENFARQIKLDAVPADIVESVEINKTLQANMDADGIGGSSTWSPKRPVSVPQSTSAGWAATRLLLADAGRWKPPVRWASALVQTSAWACSSAGPTIGTAAELTIWSLLRMPSTITGSQELPSTMARTFATTVTIGPAGGSRAARTTNRRRLESLHPRFLLGL